jgi:hypothetical protein
MPEKFWIPFLILLVFFLLIKGLYRCFRKSPVAAVLLLIFLFPVLFIWAFIELFRGPKKDEKIIVVQSDAKQ